MAYFSFDKGDNRRAIAKIRGGDANGKIIYIGEDEDEDENNVCCDQCMKGCGIDFPFCCDKCEGKCYDDELTGGNQYERLWGKEIKKLKSGKLPFINLKNGEMIPMPIMKKSKEELRENIYISGPEGAGKSTWGGLYIAEFKKLYPKSKFYIFSKVKKDKAFDDLKPIRIKLNEELINNPLTTDEFPQDSIVLFDDIDTIYDKKLRREVVDLRDRLLEDGRHRGIFVISITHNPTAGQDTKMSLLESSSIVLFPKGGDTYHMDRVLKTYLGYHPKVVRELLKLNTRWIQCHKRYPKFILHEKGCFIP
jgi:hypothetical protein